MRSFLENPQLKNQQRQSPPSPIVVLGLVAQPQFVSEKRANEILGNNTPWTSDELNPRGFDAMCEEVAIFQAERPAIQKLDSDVETVAGFLIAEIDEAMAAHQLEGQIDYDALPHQKEILDIANFLFAIANKLREKGEFPDFYDVRNNLNGLGARSDIYDRMMAAAGNILDNRQRFGQLRREIEHLLTLVFSLWCNLPQTADPVGAMSRVIGINRQNYPLELLDGRVNGMPLSEDVRQLQYKHALRCLKAIKVHLRLIGEFNEDIGLLRSQWKRYKYLIIDFLHPEASFNELRQQLELEKIERAMSRERALEIAGASNMGAVALISLA